MKSRPPIERMMVISRMLVAGQKFTRSTIAAQFEINIKTVRLDIEFMRYRLGYHIEWKAKGLPREWASYVGHPPKQRVL